MKKILGTQLRFLVFSILFFGGVYTAVITGVGQLLFSNQANGSQRMVEGEVVGSTLIGQQFLQPGYFALPIVSGLCGTRGTGIRQKDGASKRKSNHRGTG